LASITFRSEEGWFRKHVPFLGPWVDVDKWLARMALQTDSEVRGNLMVVIVQLPEDGPVLEGCFPEFRMAGGEVKIEIKAAHNKA
jgi:hypothetical protein